MKILGRNNSINVQKAMWCAAELGLEVERQDIGGTFGGNDEVWFLELNPNGRVPVLIDGETTIWESHSIVRYLCAKYQAGDLWPEDPAIRSLADRWMDWMLGTLTTVFTPVFWGLIRTAEADRDNAQIQRDGAELDRLFGLVDKQLENKAFLVGDNMTMADFPMGAAAYRWYGLDIKKSDYPHLRQYYENLCTRMPYRDHVMIPIT